MKKFLNEFKTFALRGNVIDLAVGVIIGGAFQTIIKSLVDDLIMPFVGLATGGINFADQFVVLKWAEGVKEGKKYLSLTEAKEAGATVFAYGSFITAVINFIITALVLFLIIKGINGLMISNSMHLSDWLGREVDLPIDEELYYSLLQDKITTSRKKTADAVDGDTEGSY